MESTESASSLGSSKSSSELLQLVNYDEEFNKDLDKFVSKLHSSSQFEPRVVSIIGPQSSGKSTLCNLLFDLNFNTMDEEKGRYQVTQGVWLGMNESLKTLVLDLEGTDSRERGEDALSFERKSALFALALSEVLLVNIWTNDIGRFNASNFALLKTVLELDMELFHSKSHQNSSNVLCKTKLLFVLRDHVSTSLEKLSEVLMIDLEKIWKSIEKPEEQKEALLNDFFDVEFRSLPHKVLTPELFHEKALQLRSEFESESSSIFQDSYRRGISIDGFALYAENIWNTIRGNKDLDIPAQKLMLASVRCDVFVQEAFVQADSELSRVFALCKEVFANCNGSEYEALMELQVGKCLEKIKVDASEYFWNHAKRYAVSVAEDKHSALIDRLNDKRRHLYEYFVSELIENLDTSVNSACESLQNGSMNKHPWIGFGESIKNASSQAISVLQKCCGGTGDDLQDVVMNGQQKLMGLIRTHVSRAERDTYSVILKYFVMQFNGKLEPQARDLIDKSEPELWNDVSSVIDRSLDEIGRELQSELVLGERGMDANDEMQSQFVEKVEKSCAESSVETVKGILGSERALEMRICKRFDDQFRFDGRGLPRNWTTQDDIEQLFLDARESAESMLDLYVILELKTSRVGVSEPFLSSEQVARLKEQLQRTASASFLDAQRAKDARNQVTRIPPWIFILMFLLGFNEIMAVLRNPWLFLLVLLIAPLVYLYISLDLNQIVVPALRIAVQPAVEIMKRYLDFLAEALRGNEAELMRAEVNSQRSSESVQAVSSRLNRNTTRNTNSPDVSTVSESSSSVSHDKKDL